VPSATEMETETMKEDVMIINENLVAANSLIDIIREEGRKLSR
jgi:hypothetical protein